MTSLGNTKLRPVCSCGKCTCGGVKELANYFQMEYAMSFLMGLNDTFAPIIGQILLLDPPPPINKVFSLILQEERHKSINSGELIQLIQVWRFLFRTLGQGILHIMRNRSMVQAKGKIDHFAPIAIVLVIQ